MILKLDLTDLGTEVLRGTAPYPSLSKNFTAETEEYFSANITLRSSRSQTLSKLTEVAVMLKEYRVLPSLMQVGFGVDGKTVHQRDLLVLLGETVFWRKQGIILRPPVLIAFFMGHAIWDQFPLRTMIVFPRR